MVTTVGKQTTFQSS